jgi:4-diphosphocytidyl-2-C-methyl-D-erythritol kinase
LFDLSCFSEARLTGTGACVFAQFDCELAARKAFDALQNDWQVYIARGINKSPLLTELEKF